MCRSSKDAFKGVWRRANPHSSETAMCWIHRGAPLEAATVSTQDNGAQWKPGAGGNMVDKRDREETATDSDHNNNNNNGDTQQ